MCIQYKESINSKLFIPSHDIKLKQNFYFACICGNKVKVHTKINHMYVKYFSHFISEGIGGLHDSPVYFVNTTVTFNCSVEQGTVQWITWKIPQEGISENGSCDWNYTFSSVGTFLVEVTASNLFTLVQKVLSVTVVEPISDLLLVNERHVSVGEEVTFVLFVDSKQENSTFTLSFGDGESVNNFSFSKNASLSECEIPRPGLMFDPCLSLSSVIEYTYATHGSFLAEATGWNPDKSFSSESEVIVEKLVKAAKDCEIRVFDIGGMEVNTSARVFRTQTNKLQGNIIVDNQTHVCTQIHWGLYKIDKILSNPGRANEVRFQESVQQNLSDFHIPAYSLETGDYIAELEVTSVHQQLGTHETTCLEQISLEVVPPSTVTASTDVFNISVQYAEEGYPTHMTFQTDFVSEPDIQCLWNFGDGSAPALYKGEELMSPVVHVFTESGLYLLQVACITSQGFVNRSTTLVQVNPDLDKLTCSFQDKWGNLSSPFLIGARNYSLNYRTDFENVFYRVLYDGKMQPLEDTVLQDSDHPDGTVVISQETQLSLGPGNHNFTVMVFGYDLGKQCTFEVEFQEPIHNWTTSIGMAIVAVNVTFDLLVKFYKGSPITLRTWMLKDDEMVYESVMEESRGDSFEWFILVPLQLRESGDYVIGVQASNLFSWRSTELNISAQVPITSLHVVTPPAIRYMGGIVEVNIVLYIQPVNPGPSDLYLDVTYGDGRRDVSQSTWDDDHTGTRQINVTYTQPGIYSAKIHLFNNISDLSAPVTVSVLQDIEGATVWSHSEMGVSFVGEPFYPLELPVSFNCTIQNGTIQRVAWKIADLPELNTTSCATINHTFSSPGVTTVSANVRNVFSEDIGSTNFTMIESINGLFLVNDGPVTLDVEVIFVLFLETVGTDPWYMVDFGDGQSMHVPVSNITKDPTVGQYLKPGLPLPFDPIQRYSSVISHYYPMDGHFMAVATAWNKVSSFSSLSDVFITLKPCEIPIVHIDGSSKNWNSSTKLFRNQAVTLRVNITIDCQGSEETICRWRIFQITDIFPYPSIANEIQFDGSVKMDLIELFIPPFTLEYGDYIMEISVMAIMKRTGEIGMTEYDQTYLKVVPLSLVPRIIGGTLRRLSWYSQVLVDGSSSYDPDRPPSNTRDLDLSFKWFCRKSNETFPSVLSSSSCRRCFNPGVDTIDEADAKDLIPYMVFILNIHESGCGCFNSGFAITGDPNLKIVATSSLFIPAQTLEGNKSYTILLELSKPGREAVTVEQEINLLPGDVPSVLIRCVQNCGRYLNPSERFVLSGKCEDCTEFTRPRYEWDLIPGSLESTFEEINWKRDTTTGKYNAYLVFRGGTFAGSVSEELTLKLTSSLLHFGYDSLFPPTFLPMGSSSDNFLLYVEVVVKDAFGASTITILNVTVKEPSEKESSDVFNKALSLTQGEDSEMQHLLSSGDTQAATQLITTVSSLLNSETEKQEKSPDDDSNKATRIQVREKLISDLNQVEIHDLESLQLTSAAVVEVTQEETEISTNAQLSASAMYQKMGTFLKQQSASGASTVAIEGTARQLVSGLASIMGAASSQLDAITNQTLISQNEVFSENETAAVTQNARNITLTALQTLKKIETAILHSKVPREEGTLLETSHVEVLLNRREMWEMDGKVHHFTENPYSWSTDLSTVTSHVVALEFIQGENETLLLNDMQNGVDILLDNDIQEKSVTLDELQTSEEEEKVFGFNITENTTSVMIHVKLQAKGHARANPIVVVWVYYDTVVNYTSRFSVSLPQEGHQEIHLNETHVVTSDPYSFLLEEDSFQGQGGYYLKIEIGGSYKWSDDWDVKVLVYCPQCLYWDAGLEIWSSDGCKVGPVTNLQHIHCVCHHLSTFAGGFIPLPNAISFKDDVVRFAEIFENPVTAVTVVTVILLFFLSAIWARRRDRQEEKELEVIYLADNDTAAHCEYHVTVFTGMRRGSGTSATVTLTLYGTHGSSDPHVLVAPHKQVLQRGSLDSFMITTYDSLGELTAIRLWHDNSGTHPEWYISRIIVHDLQSNGWWYFLCQSWLAINMREYSIDKTFPVATPEDLTQFHHLFLSKMQRDIKNEHLWVSVVLRSPHSTFTRLQRAACCLCIVLSAMLTNIIFYGVPEKYATNENNISFGSLSLSWSSVVIGVESSIITFPINYAIVQLFRNSRVRPSSRTKSLQSSEFTFSSLSQITLQSAYSNLSSLYQSCKIFFSDSSKSSSQTDQLSSKTTVLSDSSDLSEIPSSSFDSTTPLLGNGKSSSDKKSVLVSTSEDSRNVSEKDNSAEKLSLGRWVCLDSTDTFPGNQNDGIGLDSDHSEGKEKLEKEQVSKVRDRKTDIREKELPLSRVYAGKDNDSSGKKESVTREAENEVWSSIEEYQQILRKSLDGSIVKEKATKVKELITGVDLDDPLAHLVATNELSDAEVHQGTPYYVSHKDYLSLKLNEIRQELETTPELQRTELREKDLAGKKLDRVLLLHGWKQDERGSEEDRVENLAKEKYVESITVIQPIKVVAMAALFAIILPSHKHEEVGLGTTRIVNAREVISKGGNLDIPLQQLRKSHFYTPPPAKRVEKARQKRLAQAKMYSMVKALLGQIAFIFLVLEIAYMQRDPNTFLMNQALQNAFTEDIGEISTSDDLMEWMREAFVPVLFGGEDGFMEDDLAFRVGGPRMRQLRFSSVSGLAYLWFGCSVYYFYSLISSLESMFLFVSGGFDQFLEVTEDYPITGSLFFVLMAFALIYIFMNLLIMFIVESFMKAQLHCDENKDHRDVVSVLSEWCLSCFGFKGTRSTSNKD
ncbi:Polycystic kidney disease protein 1-like 2 [Holothuria leucospilota]|uniref:Polycystic kidney disease protein 1-like 2 n=1 Tax=Holothuria leucospilota TaxID=206669 RepID=A0A9Q1C599_HOLLE|nr:Polycystic kidney disease protein 1-like 2 [Holothuria leucospilota]